MLGKRMRAIRLLIVVGLLVCVSGVVASRTADAQDAGQSDRLLLGEIEDLRADIAALRAEIESLRAEIRSLRAELAGETPAPTAQQPAAEPLRINDSIVGEWKEYWGIPGETDVTYNDQYGIVRTPDGKLKVSILNRNQSIWDERMDGGILTFKQRTDAFIVAYELKLQSDGKWLIGTATTPYKTVPIRWERLK